MHVAALNVLALLLLAILPREDVAEDRVDVVEVNHFYDCEGRLVFDQLIFYDWCPRAERHQVRAWRLMKTPSQLPQRNWGGVGYLAVWQDGEVLRRVHAASLRETWTQYDPELLEREWLAKEKRRELHKPAPCPCPDLRQTEFTHDQVGQSRP